MPAFAAATPLLPRFRRRVLASTRCSASGTRASPATLVVIGGGPSGFFSAITAARETRADARVILLEATGRLLHKVRVSGGGRCNCTNAAPPAAFHDGYPPGRGRAEMRSPLAAWSPDDTRRWFEENGVPTKVEPGGKVFPVSDDSASVVGALTRAAQSSGVVVKTGAKVRELERVDGGPFCVRLANGRDLSCDVVCVATGSSRDAHRWGEMFGHKIVAPVPSLFTFKVHDQRLEGLAGVSVQDVVVKLVLPETRSNSVATGKPGVHAGSPRKRLRPKSRADGLAQRGPLLVTHWGLSGPAVIQLSSFGARELHACGYHAECVVDFVPSMSLEEKTANLKTARARLSQKLAHTVCPFRDGALPLRMWRSLLTYAGVESRTKWADLNNAAIDRIANSVHQSSFHVSGKGTFKEEFVTAGGISTADVSTKTFESKHTPSLFFVGEALNIDGKTGGYNFRHVAGCAIARRLEQIEMAVSV